MITIDLPSPVLCVRATHNGKQFAPTANRYFPRQDCVRRGLIAINDGAHPTGDLLPADKRIRSAEAERRAVADA